MLYIVNQYRIEPHGVDTYWGPFETVEDAHRFCLTIPSDYRWVILPLIAPPSS